MEKLNEDADNIGSSIVTNIKRISAKINGPAKNNFFGRN
jgi:hypothetical protein